MPTKTKRRKRAQPSSFNARTATAGAVDARLRQLGLQPVGEKRLANSNRAAQEREVAAELADAGLASHTTAEQKAHDVARWREQQRLKRGAIDGKTATPAQVGARMAELGYADPVLVGGLLPADRKPLVPKERGEPIRRQQSALQRVKEKKVAAELAGRRFNVAELSTEEFQAYVRHKMNS